MKTENAEKYDLSQKVSRILEELYTHNGKFTTDQELRFAAVYLSNFDDADWEEMKNNLDPDTFSYVRGIIAPKPKVVSDGDGGKTN